MHLWLYFPLQELYTLQWLTARVHRSEGSNSERDPRAVAASRALAGGVWIWYFSLPFAGAGSAAGPRMGRRTQEQENRDVQTV
jgi:hypothetical protein